MGSVYFRSALAPRGAAPRRERACAEAEGARAPVRRALVLALPRKRSRARRGQERLSGDDCDAHDTARAMARLEVCPCLAEATRMLKVGWHQ